jgi:hypothetical protein
MKMEERVKMLKEMRKTEKVADIQVFLLNKYRIFNYLKTGHNG